MRRYYYFFSLLVLLPAMSCGGGSNAINNVGLFGDWNIAMYPTNNPNPAYVFAVALSQEGGSTYSGASIAYNGTVPIPSDMCINASSLRVTATVSGDNNYSMTITDTTTNTIISVTGTLPVQTNTVTGNYSTLSSPACSQSQGTMTMTPQ